MASKNKKLKIGFIIDNTDLDYFFWRQYEYSLKSSTYEIETLIINNNKRSFRNKLIKYGFIKSISIFTYKLVISFEKILIFFIDKELLNFFKKKKIQEIEINKFYVDNIINNKSNKTTYKDEDIKIIKKLNLDVILVSCNGILSGKILNVAKKGIISLHHGDNNFYRGHAPCFWETFYRKNKIGYVIQRLTENLDAGDILYKGSIPTSFLFTHNYTKISIKSVKYLSILLEKNFKIGKRNFVDNPFYNLYSDIPTSTIQIKYVFRILFQLGKKILSRIFKINLIWNIGFLNDNKFEGVVLNKVKYFKNPRNRFFADPFAFVYKNKRFIFVEDYSFKLKKATISAIDLDKEKVFQNILNEDFHLSYPHIFQINNEIFLIPESHESNAIRLYKCISFPEKWIFVKNLINNISAADTNIIYHNNYYWLFTTIDQSGIGDHSSELYIYFSKSIYSDKWVSHPQNPVISDSNRARNGGPFLCINNKILRPFQKHVFHFYGKSIGFAEIKKLSTKNYEEISTFNIEPSFMKNILGTHTISKSKNLLTIDFVKKNILS